MFEKPAPDTGLIAEEGWPVLAVAGLATILLSFIAVPLGAFAVGLLVWLRHIMRVPSRLISSDCSAIVAPADGVVLSIEDDVMPGFDTGAAMHRITIRTRLYDAQLQRSPIDGRISDNFLIPGLFLTVGDEAAVRRDNERREITFEAASGARIMLVQIGTRTARQLVCRHGPGKYLAKGEKLGMARVAGMTDLFIPADHKIVASVGQTVLAGETLVAIAPSIRAAKKPDSPSNTASSSGPV